MKNFLISIILVITCAHLQAQSFLNRCNLKLIDVVIEDIFNPPVASRIEAYANIAAYEVLTQKYPNMQKMSGVLNGFTAIPNAANVVDYSIAAEVAFIVMAKKLVYSEYMLQDFLDAEMQVFRTQNMDTNLLNNSIAYGQEVGQHVIAWALKDNYIYTRTLQRNVLKDGLDYWKPTAPDYANGLEPNWYLMRSFISDSSNYVKAKPNVKFSQSKKSMYYKNAMACYKNSLTQDSTNINTAIYWDDNPNTAVVKGHLKYFIHKATPGGHWLKITSQIITEKSIDEATSAKLFTTVALSIYEGFLNCWATKYATNSVRPETYIQRLINAQWRPLIITPPFPEYTSGHSVISAAAANTLTHFLGENFAFTDSSQNYLGLTPRFFNSFHEAAQQASISRFYGGIHYMPSLDNGSLQGIQVSQYLLKKTGFYQQK